MNNEVLIQQIRSDINLSIDFACLHLFTLISLNKQFNV